MPNPVMIKNYECEYCGKVFAKLNLCYYHEFNEHRCPNCEHAYYVYGCEFKCERKEENKRCKFKLNKTYVLNKISELEKECDKYECTINDYIFDNQVKHYPWELEDSLVKTKCKLKEYRKLFEKYEKSN